MPKVTFNVKVEVEIAETTDELLQVAGRELVAGINGSVNDNLNVEDLVVTAIDAVEVITRKVNCLPDEELAELAQ